MFTPMHNRYTQSFFRLFIKNIQRLNIILHTKTKLAHGNISLNSEKFDKNLLFSFKTFLETKKKKSYNVFLRIFSIKNIKKMI